ncbi:MAG: TonB-dependent receptor plug domain-containing protein, partial [Prevotella sp.]|nr:TonB-dependent receptor plug domain-containing protein [Prevotella sp.]
MRKKLVFMLMLVMAITALPLHAQNAGAKLTMSFDNETLPQVFLRLEQSSTYKFLFTYDDVNKYKVTGKMQNASVLEIVDFALKNTPLEYKVNGKFINVTLKSDNRQQSSTSRRTYGGYVVDENNEPVIGAQVKVVGDGITQNVITVTDLNGAFSFDYSFSGQVQVQISYVGMQTVTVPLRQGMKVVMKEDAKALGEVVVTGIFRKARESYTGSVSTIDKEQLEQFRGQNLLQTLKNVDASINFGIDNLNGSNPNNLPNINIRGTSSLPMSVEEFNAGQSSNPNTPLIIMDGFEISLTKLMDYNDEEIESINILKDAAATAIYGSRGANGVIVVVSKQPEPGKLRVNVEAGLALEVPDLTSYHLLNAADKLELERKAGLFDYPYGIDDSKSNFDFYYKDAYNKRLYDVLRGVDTDWLSKPLRTGVGQRYNLRVEGGSKEFRWAA